METFVNDYYQQIEAATTEADRSQIKVEFAAKLQTLTDEQRQEVKTLVGDRVYLFLETLKPIDEAIERFEQYLNKPNPQILNKAA